MTFNEDVLPYLEAFLEETGEQLQTLEEKLVRLEKEPGDRSCLEDIFRIAHTLKGNAATVGFEGMAGLAHRMEDLLDCLRRGKACLTPEVTDVLLASLDALKGLADEACGRGGCSADLVALTGKLECLARGSEATGETPAAAGGQTFRVRVVLEEDCLMRAARAYVVLRCLEELGSILEARPSFEEVQGVGFEGTEIEASVTMAENPELLVEVLSTTPEVKEVQVVPIKKGPTEVRVAIGGCLDPQVVAGRLLQQGAERVILDLSGLRELSPAGLDWLLSLKEAGTVEFILPRLPAGRRLFELLAIGSPLPQERNWPGAEGNLFPPSGCAAPVSTHIRI